MRVSASIYSWKNRRIQDVAKILDAMLVDYIHLDCNDDVRVFDDIAEIRQVTTTPIDLHVITDSPEKYYEKIKESGVEMVCFQQENLKRGLNVPEFINSKVGLAISSETSFDYFREIQDRLSYVMLMTTTPGRSGGVFDRRTFRKVRAFKSEFPCKSVHVDGGVNNEVSFVLRNIGVACVISGSYLATSETPAAALVGLRSNPSNLGYKVRDFMLNGNELPVLKEAELTLQSLLHAINSKKLGFAVILDEDERTVGIATDGDVRRGLIKNINSLDQISVTDFINRNFISISQDLTLMEMLELIQTCQKTILFLPVDDDRGRNVGAVSFHNLIKGEL